jgi:hypothetical protein
MALHSIPAKKYHAPCDQATFLSASFFTVQFESPRLSFNFITHRLYILPACAVEVFFLCTLRVLIGINFGLNYVVAFRVFPFPSTENPNSSQFTK